MSKPQHWLGALLAVQVLLSGGLYVHGRQQEARQSQQAAILSFDKTKVDKLVLTDKDGTKVTLLKKGDTWQLPDYDGLPVDKDRLDDLLTTLSDLKGGWPVSTSADSQEQFEVGEKKFSRKLQAFAGEQPLVDLYLGTSPGFRKTHVRSAKDTSIFAAAINSMDVPVANDQWFDRSLLKANDLTEIKGPGFALKKSGQDWALDGAGAAKLNSNNANLLDKSLSGLRVESVEKAAPPGAPAYTLDVVAGGKPLSYQFWKSGETCVVKRSDNPKSFVMSKPIYEVLVANTLAKLTEPAAPSPAGAPTPGAGPAASATPGAAATP